VSHSSIVNSPFHNQLRAASGRLFWVGLILLVLGIAAVIFPMISTLVATMLVGWVLLIFGVVMLVGAFSIHGTGPFFAALLMSLLAIAGGVFLLFNPASGAVVLTVMVGAIMMIQGAFEIVFALEVRPHVGWLGMLISGLASVALAILISATWPGISVVMLGILLGVNFITTGLGYIFISRALKPLA
jgi:uncharacterized membrane protein HdeD (DUF308 family)